MVHDPEGSIPRIEEIASGMISGTIRPLLGARLLFPELHKLEKHVDPAIVRVITGVHSESDSLPLGDERKYWSPEALREKDELSASFEARVGPQLIDVAKQLVRQFSDKSSLP
jgi:hypothetical protein